MMTPTILELIETAPDGEVCRSCPSNPPAVGAERRSDGTTVPVCAGCLDRARAVYERHRSAAALLATGGAISREEVDELATQLTAAGEDWPTTAATLAHVQEWAHAAGEYRDLVTLDVPVVRNGLTYVAVLYRDDDGRWWGTGWSDASRSRIYATTAPD